VSARERTLENYLLDVVGKVARHREDVLLAVTLPDLEEMVMAFDDANYRLWRSVFRREEY
jgi:hypothetical protein